MSKPFASNAVAPVVVRRLAITRQRLAGSRPTPGPQGLLYTLPILRGDHLIGRIDPLMNCAKASLRVNAVYAELIAPFDRAIGRAVAGALSALAGFLGATSIDYDACCLPPAWKRELLA